MFRFGLFKKSYWLVQQGHSHVSDESYAPSRSKPITSMDRTLQYGIVSISRVIHSQNKYFWFGASKKENEEKTK